MQKIAQYYQIFCNLSLDVVTGVICCMLPLPVCFGVSLPGIWYAALPLGTWIVYLLDHVVDVLRKEDEYPTPRHRFVRRHLKPIIGIMMLISLSLCIALVLHFDPTLFACGLIVGALVVVHLAVVQLNPQAKSVFNNKELAIAVLYATGIYICPLAFVLRAAGPVTVPLLCFFLFLITTFVNLLTASLIEEPHDEQMQNSSLVRVLSVPVAKQILNALLLLSIAGGAMIAVISTAPAAVLALIYTAMALAHLLVLRFREQLMPYLAYRKIGEMLFWTPVVVFLVFG